MFYKCAKKGDRRVTLIAGKDHAGKKRGEDVRGFVTNLLWEVSPSRRNEPRPIDKTGEVTVGATWKLKSCLNRDPSKRISRDPHKSQARRSNRKK